MLRPGLVPQGALLHIPLKGVFEQVVRILANLLAYGVTEPFTVSLQVIIIITVINPNPDYIILCVGVPYIRNPVIPLRGLTSGLLVTCFCNLHESPGYNNYASILN